jgi:hypothetical protein
VVVTYPIPYIRRGDVAANRESDILMLGHDNRTTYSCPEDGGSEARTSQSPFHLVRVRTSRGASLEALRWWQQAAE